MSGLEQARNKEKVYSATLEITLALILNIAWLDVSFSVETYKEKTHLLPASSCNSPFPLTSYFYSWVKSNIKVSFGKEYDAMVESDALLLKEKSSKILPKKSSSLENSQKNLRGNEIDFQKQIHPFARISKFIPYKRYIFGRKKEIYGILKWQFCLEPLWLTRSGFWEHFPLKM